MEQPPDVPQGRYPRQDLTEQQVLPGRSGAPRLFGIAGLVVVVLVAVALWFVLDDGGEPDRDAYCEALTDVTDGGDLAGALQTADERTLEDLDDVAALAPDVVADDWETLTEVARDPAAVADGGDLSTVVSVFSAVRGIARDARDACGLELDIPLP